jgi:3-hydroxyisobutyrate dehydrogenase
MTRVGFIGLGSQGGPMARRIVDAGYPTTLWARRAESLAPFTDTPAMIASSPRALAEASDVVGICVLADADVDAVVDGPDGVLAGLAPGGVLVVHSTVHPDTCIRLAARAAERGIAVLDAPVSGGGAMAAQRQLLVMVGGDGDVLARCLPVFETFGDPVIHLGPVGSGQLAKLLNNLLFTAHLSLGTHAFDLARTLGVEPASLARVLERGTGGSAAIRILANGGFSARLMGAVAGPLLRKDTQLVLDLAGDGRAVPDVLRDVADDALQMMDNPRGPTNGETS